MVNLYTDTRYWSEGQRQAAYFLQMAIQRMYQEKMSDYDIFFWFQAYMGEPLEKKGLKIYIGSAEEDEGIG